VVISVMAVIGFADGRSDIVQFAKDREEWLRTVLELPGGIPSIRAITAQLRLPFLEQAPGRPIPAQPAVSEKAPSPITQISLSLANSSSAAS